jgi:hypothetical protein
VVIQAREAEAKQAREAGLAAFKVADLAVPALGDEVLDGGFWISIR